MNLKRGSQKQQHYLEKCRKRKAKMEALRAKDWTLKAIGDRFRVTRQRVQQILSRP